LLEQSPSLRRKLARGLGDNYSRAVKRAAAEMSLGVEHFPRVCPYGVEQMLDEDFLP